MMDQLLHRWQMAYDRMESDEQVQAARQVLKEATDILVDAELPYRETLAELEAEIRPAVIDLGHTYEQHGVKVNYRRGSKRVTYDWRRVDSVQRVLRDIVPSSAEELALARKETIGKPSVRVVRVT